MPDWTAFGAVAGLVLALVLGLARVTTAAMTADDDGGETAASASGTAAPSDEREAAETSPPVVPADGTDADDEHSTVDDGAAADGSAVDDGRTVGDSVTVEADAALDDAVVDTDSATDDGALGDPSPATGADANDGLDSIPTTALLVNVVLTHGVLAAVLLGAAALTAVPATALGVTAAPWSTGLPAVLGGVGLGGALALANGVLAANLDRFGIDYSDALRTALTPHSKLGWAALLGVILPLVSLFEELLFRGVLVGAAAAATGLSPWPFVVLSSIAFAMGHGLQGRGGILVTGSLGAVLAAAFVLTESLLLVIVAHYVVNAAEFLLHEWLGVDVHGRLGL